MPLIIQYSIDSQISHGVLLCDVKESKNNFKGFLCGTFTKILKKKKIQKPETSYPMKNSIYCFRTKNILLSHCSFMMAGLGPKSNFLIKQRTHTNTMSKNSRVILALWPTQTSKRKQKSNLCHTSKSHAFGHLKLQFNRFNVMTNDYLCNFFSCWPHIFFVVFFHAYTTTSTAVGWYKLQNGRSTQWWIHFIVWGKGFGKNGISMV